MCCRSVAYGTPGDDAVGYAKFFSPSHDVVVRVFDDTSNVIETYKRAADFKEW
jgi:hypothetical protein